MSVEVVMPQMGESITEGTVSKWLKQVGERVEKDETLLEISTDKVDAEVPSPGEGILIEVRAQEGETVEVGSVVAVIGDSAEAGSVPSPTSHVPSQIETATSDVEPETGAEKTPDLEPVTAAEPT